MDQRVLPIDERWRVEHLVRIEHPAVIATGAAFDLPAGRGKQAPSWIRRINIEWLFRLICKATRLSRHDAECALLGMVAFPLAGRAAQDTIR